MQCVGSLKAKGKRQHSKAEKERTYLKQGLSLLLEDCRCVPTFASLLLLPANKAKVERGKSKGTSINSVVSTFDSPFSLSSLWVGGGNMIKASARIAYPLLCL